MGSARMAGVGIALIAGIAFAADQAHAVPDIDIEKFVNGVDADTAADPPLIPVGSTAVFTYHVTNTGTDPFNFFDIFIEDDNGTPGDPSDDFTPELDPSTDDGGDNLLQPGEIWFYEAALPALPGLQTNIGFVAVAGVSDSDPANYIGIPEPATLGLLGAGLAGLGAAALTRRSRARSRARR